LKRLRMAWCGLRGGHVIKFREYEHQFRDAILDCTRCPWSILIVRKLRGEWPPPVGPPVKFISIDEVP